MRDPAKAACVLIALLVTFEARADERSLDEVVVERSRYATEVTLGAKTPRSARETPASVSALSAQRIEDQNLWNMQDVLRQLPGVTVIPGNPSTSLVLSRGYAMSRMRDGVPTMGQLNGVSFLDPAVYERIEVQRGPAGLFQGSGEPAGSLNFVSKRALEQFALAGSYGFGSWDDHRAVLDATGPLIASGALRARIVGVYQDRDHFAQAHYERSTGYATLDWSIGPRTTLTAQLAIQQDSSRRSYAGLPAYESGRQLAVPRSTSIAALWARRREDIHEYGLSLKHEFAGSWRLVAQWRASRENPMYLSSTAQGEVRESDSTLPIGRTHTLYDFDRDGFDIFASGDIAVLGRTHSLTFGYNHDVFDSGFQTVDAPIVRMPFAEAPLVPLPELAYNRFGETQRRQSGLYAQAHVSLLESLTLIAGARLSDVDTRTRSGPLSTSPRWSSLGRADGEVTPMAGLIFDANEWLSLYTSYSDIFVPESALAADGRPLDPRVGRQYEAGAKSEWYGGALRASVSVFDMKESGRALADDAHPGFYVNGGEVESKGWETEIVGSPAQGYEVQVGYTRVDARYTKAAPNLVGTAYSFLVPRHSWKLWALRRAGSGLTVGVGLNGQSRIENGPRTQGDYSVASAMISYRLNETLSIAFNANNVFDKVYYIRIGTSGANSFGTPRSYSLALRLAY